MAADQGDIDSVSNVNTKNLGDAAAFAMGLAFADQVAHQRAMNSIREASVGAVVSSRPDLVRGAHDLVESRELEIRGAGA